jgi:two-component system, NarL family, response regulator LiaR
MPVPITRYKNVILYGISLAALTILLRWLELRYLILNNSFEVYAGFIAIIFTSLGIWLALKLIKPNVKTVILEREVPVRDFSVDKETMIRLGLSKREVEVLNKMSEGLSNQEIADSLFLSLNTVKTHTSNLFEKLEVKRRTQAVEKARKLNIIP